MGLYLKDGVWWYSITPKGCKRIRESTGTKNKKRAERIFAKVQTDIEEGRWFENQAKRKTLKEMIERYKAEYTEKRTYFPKARDKSIIKHLYSFFGENSTLENVASQVGGYEMFRKCKVAKPATIVKELGLLRRMFNVARKQWKWKIPNPVSEIELPKVNNARVRYLDSVGLQQLFSALDRIEETWLRPLVIVALETGLRLSNLCNLIWSEVNLVSRIITIHADKMKNREYIGIPLSEAAYKAIRELQRVQSISNYVFHDKGEQLCYRKVQRAFSKALGVAEIEDFHFHDLRHTFASRLVQSGVDIYAVQKLLGHKDGRMTQRYAHLSISTLRDAVSKLDVTLLSPSENYERAVPV
jgi:integrase